MSLVEKYRLWKRNDAVKNISQDIVDFFRTNPSEDQLVILDRVSKKDNLLFGIIALCYFALGIVLGFLIAHSYYLKTLVELKSQLP